MTREEIRIQTIAQLERISGMLGSMGEEKDWTEYAIRALEQEPILDKIRAQIKSNLRGVEIALEVVVENDPLRLKMEGAKVTLEECLEIIDKYKAETEAEDGKDVV